MREFFGFGGYQRPAEGYMSWQHLTFVTALTAAMVILAVLLGKRNAGLEERIKNKALIAAAFLIDGLELFKIILLCFRSKNAMHWLNDLPLFLCSIQLITIPLAAFSKGRLREAALDFVCIFGIIGAILGTYAAGNNYSAYPVLSFDNVVSGLTHCISGFCSLYIMFSGLASMKKKNIWLTTVILLCFCVAAYIANIFTNANYMFLLRGDGTPYDILFDLVGGDPVVYPICVVVLFFVYICIFYSVFFLVKKRKKAPAKVS